ncbi:hypothetical protein [Nocardia sp. NPDC127526]|uniref:hypothetical protein n=1 Tax=Nocardia sp. NPDC127526 TaxID=3345393 RepID=UPI0036439026
MHHDIRMPRWEGFSPDAAWRAIQDLKFQMEDMSNAFEALEDAGRADYKETERYHGERESLQEQHDLAEAKLTVWLLGGGWRPAGMPAPEIAVRRSAISSRRVLDPDGQWADIVRLEATLDALNDADPDGMDIERIRSREELGDQIRDLKADLLDQLAVGANPPAAWTVTS